MRSFLQKRRSLFESRGSKSVVQRCKLCQRCWNRCSRPSATIFFCIFGCLAAVDIWRRVAGCVNRDGQQGQNVKNWVTLRTSEMTHNASQKTGGLLTPNTFRITATVSFIGVPLYDFNIVLRRNFLDLIYMNFWSDNKHSGTLMS